MDLTHFVGLFVREFWARRAQRDERNNLLSKEEKHDSSQMYLQDALQYRVQDIPIAKFTAVLFTGKRSAGGGLTLRRIQAADTKNQVLYISLKHLIHSTQRATKRERQQHRILPQRVRTAGKARAAPTETALHTEKTTGQPPRPETSLATQQHEINLQYCTPGKTEVDFRFRASERQHQPTNLRDRSPLLSPFSERGKRGAAGRGDALVGTIPDRCWWHKNRTGTKAPGGAAQPPSRQDSVESNRRRDTQFANQPSRLVTLGQPQKPEVAGKPHSFSGE